MRPTLCEFAGGEPAFLALATAHYARCLADPGVYGESVRKTGLSRDGGRRVEFAIADAVS